ncbi:hypothetical protein CsSME_00016370 [Camellia sinensis var. sinensis]
MEVTMFKYDEGDKVNPTYFKSLAGSLGYLTTMLPDILFAVSLVSRYMEEPKMPHLKAAKRILRYVKGYNHSGWAGNVCDCKSTTEFVFRLGDTAFTWSLKKQPIKHVMLSG